MRPVTPRAATAGRPACRKVVTCSAVACLVGLAAACDLGDPGPTTTTSAPPTTAPTPPPSCRGSGSSATKNVAYKTVSGVAPNLLSLDYYTPTRPARCGPAPIVVYVHGGGFRNGDKSNKIEDKVKLFTGEGWVFASVNYRLSPDPPNDRAGQVRYPTHEQDVVAAVSWLKKNAPRLDGDPNRIFLVGHSSGAYITSLISTDTSFLTAAGLGTGNVRCTVSLDTEYDAANQIAQGGSQEILYRNALGNDPATWSKASPVNHTRAGAARPKFLIYTQGVPRRTAQARAFASALTSGGTSASAIDVNPLDHEAINRAVGAPGERTVTPPLMTFLRSCT